MFWTLNDTGLKSAYRIFADGSFFDQTGRAAYGGFIENPIREKLNYSRSFSGGSSRTSATVWLSSPVNSGPERQPQHIVSLTS